MQNESGDVVDTYIPRKWYVHLLEYILRLKMSSQTLLLPMFLYKTHQLEDILHFHHEVRYHRPRAILWCLEVSVNDDCFNVRRGGGLTSCILLVSQASRIFPCVHGGGEREGK